MRGSAVAALFPLRAQAQPRSPRRRSPARSLDLPGPSSQFPRTLLERVERGRRDTGGGEEAALGEGRALARILSFCALQIPTASVRVGWAAGPGSGFGRWMLLHVPGGGTGLAAYCALKTGPSAPALPVPQPCSLTGPASALLTGKSLKTLMSKGILQVHPPICDCPGCRISSPVVRCGRKIGALGVFLLPRGACVCSLGSRALTSTLPVCRSEPPKGK